MLVAMLIQDGLGNAEVDGTLVFDIADLEFAAADSCGHLGQPVSFFLRNFHFLVPYGLVGRFRL